LFSNCLFSGYQQPFDNCCYKSIGRQLTTWPRRLRLTATVIPKGGPCDNPSIRKQYTSFGKKMTKQPTISLQDALQQFISASVSGKRKMPSVRKISAAVITHYKHVLALVQAFQQQSGQNYQLTHHRHIRQAQAAKTAGYWQKFQRHFSQWLYRHKSYCDNMVATLRNGLFQRIIMQPTSSAPLVQNNCRM